jgi:serine/threonine protein kinase
MAATIEQFIRDLVRSRVLDDDELAAIKADVRAKRLPRDAEGLARELVRQGRLTKYQAAAIYQGRAGELAMGNYVIVDKVGAGRMGFVYKAKRRGMDEAFALKVLPARRLEESATARQRFEREIQLHVRLSHPNIVRIHDAGEHNGAPYLVMELVHGQDLSSLVKSSPLSVAQTVDYILQVARGLAYAHGEGVVHRDIKPANLLLDVSGAVKILDMGLARLEDADEESSGGRLTLQMQLLGTPHYMAPEQAVDPRNADARADVYSLGCTWFYLLTGRPPYPRDSTIDALMAHREEPIPRLPLVREDVPEELDAIFQRMLAKRADERFASMAEVVAALEAWQQGPQAPPLSPGTTTTVAISTADASTIEGTAPIAIILGPRTQPPAAAEDQAAESRWLPWRMLPWRMGSDSKLGRAAVVIAAVAIALGIAAAIFFLL